MSFKPDENILVSYLYGELDEKDSAELEMYLQAHPEIKEKLQAMSVSRELIGALKDKEVIAPPIFMDGDPSVRPIWRSAYFKVAVSVAASFLFLMVAARLIGVEIRYNQGELRMSFGRMPSVVSGPAIQATGMTHEDVQSLINLSLIRNNESITANWADGQKKIDQSIRQPLERH